MVNSSFFQGLKILCDEIALLIFFYTILYFFHSLAILLLFFRRKNLIDLICFSEFLIKKLMLLFVNLLMSEFTEESLKCVDIYSSPVMIFDMVFSLLSLSLNFN